MSRHKPPLREAFDARYRINSETGCWEWSGATSKGGYGQYQVAKFRPSGAETYTRKRIYAHRLAWTLHYGDIPSGYEVCHRCDNPPCVNPAHLFLGTHADNQNDMHQKGRSARGSRQGGSKLTEDAVREIMASTLPSEVLARRFVVSFQTVNSIRCGHGWKHLGLTRSDDPKANQSHVGSAHPSAVLKESDIPHIRARLMRGERCASIGLSYGVTGALIRHIRNGKIWRHVP